MKIRFLVLMALALPAVFLSMKGARGAQDDTPNLPEGAGKSDVARICSKCHGLEMFAAARKSAPEWNLIVDKMLEEGLEISDEEGETVITYLSKFLGKEAAPAKVNVNKAAAKELEQTLGLSDTEAEAIVKYRGAHGSFKDWRDLTKVDGVDAKKIEAHKDQIDL